MAITIDGTAGTIAGLVAGGLPTGSVTSATIADATIASGDIASGVVPAGGKVLQVVSTVWTGGMTTTSNTLAATGLTCNITPSSASSKILVTVTGSDQTMSANDVGNLNSIFRTPAGGSATNIAASESIQICYEAVGGSWLAMPICMQKLDSPSTTTTLTYTYYFATRDSGNTSKVNMFGAETIMTLMEIAG